jgi:hypothetical protein
LNTPLLRAISLGLVLLSGATLALAQDITSNLALWYRFDDGSGTSPTDSSGNGITGTSVGTPTWTAAASCKVQGCLTFNGTTQRVDFSGTAVNITGNITLAAWVKTSSTAPNSIIGGYQGISPYAGYGLRVTPTTGTIGFWNGAGWADATGVTAITDNAWHHVVASLAGSTVTLYVDAGTGSAKASGAVNSYTGTRAIASVQGGSNWFAGLIDEVRIYARALTAADVAALYAFGTSSSSKRRALQY